MTQWLGALVALPEDLGWIPAPKWWLTNTCNGRSRGPDALFWPPQHAHSCTAQIHEHLHAHTKKSFSKQAQTFSSTLESFST